MSFSASLPDQTRPCADLLDHLSVEFAGVGDLGDELVVDPIDGTLKDGELGLSLGPDDAGCIGKLAGLHRVESQAKLVGRQALKIEEHAKHADRAGDGGRLGKDAGPWPLLSE